MEFCWILGSRCFVSKSHSPKLQYKSAPTSECPTFSISLYLFANLHTKAIYHRSKLTRKWSSPHTPRWSSPWNLVTIERQMKHDPFKTTQYQDQLEKFQRSKQPSSTNRFFYFCFKNLCDHLAQTPGYFFFIQISYAFTISSLIHFFCLIFSAHSCPFEFKIPFEFALNFMDLFCI